MQNSVSRRTLLKTLLAGSALVGTSAFLPEKWVKPVVESGVLPQHAAASACPIRRSTIATTIYSSDNPIWTFYAFDVPITDAQIRACGVTSLTLSWTGSASTGTTHAQIRLAQTQLLSTTKYGSFPAGTPSPITVTDPGYWTGNAPYNGVNIATEAGTTWDVGQVTVTLS